MKKRIKHKAVGQAPQAKQPVSAVPVSERTKRKVRRVNKVRSHKRIRFPLGAEYILQQYYDIIVDERFIEEEWASHFTKRNEYVEESVARFKRMLRAIVADRKVVTEVLDWSVLAAGYGWRLLCS